MFFFLVNVFDLNAGLSVLEVVFFQATKIGKMDAPFISLLGFFLPIACL